MMSRRASRSATPPSPLEEYQQLRLGDIMADLPSLDLAGLRLVQYLEEAGQRRSQILDAIAQRVAALEEAESESGLGDDSPAVTAAQVAPVALEQSSKGGTAVRRPDRAGRSDSGRRRDGGRRPDGVARPDGVGRPDRVGASDVGGRPSVQVSADLFDRVDGLLARDAAKRAPSDPAPLPEPLPAVIAPRGALRRRARGRLPKVLAGLLAVAVVAAGALTYLGHGDSSPANAASPVSAETDPLARRVVTAVPADYAAQPDSAAGSGSMDVARAARVGGVPDAEAALVSAGFLHGVDRLWQTPGHQLVVYLYHFKDASGASAYGRQLVATTRANPQSPVSDFSIAGIPGAVGMSRSTAGGGTTATAVFTKSQYLVRILVSRVGGPDSAAAQQLAQAQYALL